ncbi:hypothetical protein [Prauserella muralis]|uniref:Uncharacterized protein n=1 Tax=Prauserella muralis TaxID=588067 RepID=A0A2V4ALH3_9PSEU|nr:hypothetical protein [Prauserella muralis]PXY21151.1 hypothetical protein BAY60_27170 [Prauserella muralis]TWE30239.1 hypothetical protein FHX69_2936 [Prauserella muralis]
MNTPTSAELAPFRDTCKSCRAHILWATTEDGERMPVDLKPSSNGNVMIAVQGGRLMAGVLGRAPAARKRLLGVLLHVAHFATCPKANQHRRGKH